MKTFHKIPGTQPSPAMVSNTHWTRSRSVAAEGEGLEKPGHQQEGVASPSVQPERDEDLTPSSNDDDEGNNPREDDEKVLQRTLEAIQKKCRMAALQRQIEVEQRALEEASPLPTITGMICPRSDTSAITTPALKQSRRDETDLEDDSRLRVKDPSVYEGKKQGELDTFILDCEHIFRTRSSQYKKERRRADYAEGWIKPELAKLWTLKVERLGEDYHSWSNLKTYLLDDLCQKALRAKDACSRWLQASQHQYQMMSSFVNYIDQLEKDLSPIPKDLKRLRLMCTFRPEIELTIE